MLGRLVEMEPGSQKGLMFPAVQQQKNGSECGVFAIAFAAAIITDVSVEAAAFISKGCVLFFRML